MSQFGPMFDLKINVGHCDLYFMVQWFCLISWRLVDVWTPLFGIMSRVDPKFDLKINVGHCDLYFMVQWFCLISWRLFDIWSSDFALYLEDYLMCEHHYCRTCFSIGDLGVQVSVHLFVRPSVRPSVNIYHWCLVSATPLTVFYRSFWNFANVFFMVWGCACGLDIIVRLFFITFSTLWT